MFEHSAHPQAVEISGSVEGSPLVLTWPDHRPRILDLELAERLGYDRPRAIRGLIRRLVDASALVDVQQHATSRAFELEPDADGGAGASVGEAEYWLTEEQALLICARSHTHRGPSGGASARTEAVQRIIASFVAARDVHAGEEVEVRRSELEVRRLEAEAATARARSAILDTTLSQIAELERHGAITPATAVYQRARVVRDLLGIDLVERRELRPALARAVQISLPFGGLADPRDPGTETHALVPMPLGGALTRQVDPGDPAALLTHDNASSTALATSPASAHSALVSARRMVAIDAIDTTGFLSARNVGSEFSLSGQVVGRLARDMGLYGNDAYGLWRQFQPNDGSNPLRHWMYSEDARDLLRPRLAEIRRARDARNPHAHVPPIPSVPRHEMDEAS